MKTKFSRRIGKFAKMALLPKGWRDYGLSLISAIFRTPVVWGMPTSIFIETSNYCNLRCPVCRTGSGNLKRPKGNMSFNNFRKIVDQVQGYVNTASLYFMGEPFLNPEIYKIISYARDNGIFTTICTNGELLEPERVVRSGLNEIWFQIGGLTDKTHSLYRIGGDFNKIKQNIIEMNAVRKRLKSQIKMVIGLIVMKHNENELKDFNGFCEDLNVDKGIKIIPRIYNVGHAEMFLPKSKEFNKYDLGRIQRGVESMLVRRLPNRCMWLWFCTEITWDGNVVPCCEDEEARFVMGNVFKEDLSSIWNNKSYKDFRRRILSNQSDIAICRNCLGLPAPLLN